MAVKYYLLAPLQNFFTDSLGNPLVGGYLYSYKATDHATEKSISKVETPLNASDYYTNPIELDASGSVPVPYTLYFADDEQYYLVLTNSNQNPLNPPEPTNIVRTWDDFGVQGGNTPTFDEVDYTNYFQNADYRFWRDKKYEQTDLTTTNELIYVADSGWYFIRNNTSGTTSISFDSFTAGQTDVPDNPLYYIHVTGSSVGTGETQKDIVQKINDVTAFSGSQIQIALYAKSDLSDLAELIIIQHFGVSAEVQILNNLQLSPAWSLYTFDITLPSVSGKSIDPNDNYLLIGIRSPLNKVCDYSATKWQLNRGQKLLEYTYKTPEIEQATERTYQLPFPTDNDYGLPLKWTGEKYEFDSSEIGKISTYMTDSEVGYLLCDGSTYCTLDKISESGNRITYSRLYDKWQNGCSTGLSSWFLTDGNAFGFGDDGFEPTANWGSNFIFFNTKEKTDITAWTDNNTTFTFSKLMAGIDILCIAEYGFDVKYIDSQYVAGKYYNNNQIVVRNSNNGAVTAPNAGTLTSLINIYVLVVGDSTHAESFYINFDYSAITTDYAGKYFEFSTTSVNYYVWYTVDGVGTDPTVVGRTPIRVDLSSWMKAQNIARITQESLKGKTTHQITFVAASSLTGGTYCNIYNSTIHYVPYLIIDGVGDDPKISNTTSIPVVLDSSDSVDDVRDKFTNAIKKIFFQVPDMRGLFLRGTDLSRELDIDSSTSRFDRGDLSIDKPGSKQGYAVEIHAHTYSDGFLSAYSPSDGGEALRDKSNQPTEEVGEGNETRPTNIYVNFFVKY